MADGRDHGTCRRPVVQGSPPVHGAERRRVGRSMDSWSSLLVVRSGHTEFMAQIHGL